MSELAFDKEGNPFRFSRRTKKLRPRRWKNAGQRGTCAAVLDPDGEPLLVDADAEYTEFRSAVGNVSGFYRLDQCDDDGAPIEDAPPAYVSIESARNAAPTGELDSRDALIRDLAQINAEMTRTIVERFSNVMQAAADVLEAADGAGLPRRAPPPPLAAPAAAEDDDDDDDDDEELEEDESPKRRGRHPSELMWETVAPMIPMVGVWVQSMISKRMAQPSSAAPATATATATATGAVPEPASAPGAPAPAAGATTIPAAWPAAAAASTAVEEPAAWPAAVPPAWPVAVPGAYHVAPDAPVSAPASAVTPPAAAAAVVSATPMAAVGPSAPAARAVPHEPTFALAAGPATAAVGGPAAASSPVPVSLATGKAMAAPVTAPGAGGAIAAGAGAPAAATDERQRLEEAGVTSMVLVSADPVGVAQIEGPRNAPPVVEPTAEQWAHLYAIRAQLTPREASIASTVVVRMAPELRAQWLAQLSALSVEQAAEVVRSMIPKPASKQARGKKAPADDPGDGQEDG